jgi:threonine/homoserine/homoserine lactone efflux protein
VSRPRTRGPQRVAQRAAERRRENLDIFLGVLGFFTALLLIATVSAELKGEPSLGRAVVLAIFVGLIYLTWRIRRELQRRAAAPPSPRTDVRD